MHLDDNSDVSRWLSSIKMAIGHVDRCIRRAAQRYRDMRRAGRYSQMKRGQNNQQLR